MWLLVLVGALGVDVSFVVLPCLVLPYLSCLALPCSRLALSRLAMPCLVLSCFVPGIVPEKQAEQSGSLKQR